MSNNSKHVYMEESPVNTKESTSEKDEAKQSKEEEHVTGRKKRRERKLKTQPKNVTGSDAPDTTGPRGICVSDFIQARAMELHNMTTAISQHSSARRTFQTLPRHMRRRSMSHNIKRLPHRLREQAKNEVVECVAKKLSRKTRRRSNKLVEVYGSRSGKCQWLQSHIWHAKRFKMMEYHGYKIAEQCCDKGARATYRYLHTGCLLYDSSYHGCVELLGSQGDIITVLQPLMSKQVGITIEAKDCLGGCRSGEVILYQSYSYPTNAIGPAQFIWRPDHTTAQRQLWLLVHPAITDVLLKEISNNIKTLLGADINDVIVNNLQDKMVHYKLIGAQCNNVIVQIIDDPVWEPLDDKADTGKWWVTKQPTDNDGLADKKKFFEHLSQTESPAEFPNRMIVGLTVKDFRLSMPDKKLNITQPAATSFNSVPEIVTPQLSQCHIWNKVVRDNEQAIVPEYLINKIRSEKFCDISEQLKEIEEYLPLLLLHQTVDGVGVGWDILAPVKWGKPLWLSLVYHGARVIGYEEMRHYHLERSILHYPTDYPDTIAGQQLELNNLKMLQSKYCKYPPDKRPNFGKLNSLSPFQPFWSSLISQDTEHEDKEQDDGPVCKRARLSTDIGLVKDGEISYYVLRSVKHLVALARLLDNLKVAVKPACEENWLSLLNDMQLSTLIIDHPKSLVPVSFVMCHRGNPIARSMICIPSTEDLLKLSNDDSYYGPVEVLNKKGVCVVHDDKLLIGTTLLTSKKFKMAKKELKIGKIPKSQVTKDVNHHGDQSTDEITATLQLKSLQSSRPIIGYVTNAGYVFSQGAGSGVGLCSLTGLLEFMKSCYLHDHPVTVLVREHDSLQYRFAFVNILQMYNCM